jgi:mono/diheme cytochrome c family protein
MERTILMASPRIALRITAVGAILLVAAAASVHADEPAQQFGSYQEQVAPLLAKYCLACHNPDKAKGELNLAKYSDDAGIAADRKTWERVAEFIETAEMPPSGKPGPSDEERELLVAWIESKVSSVDCKLESDPGQVTMRRLNRVEYNNTIRDLVGIDFRPADDFPSDDVGYGFDNIGDVLTLSPMLMEKYLDAAEQIAERAIVVDHVLKGETTSFPAKALPDDAGGSRNGESRMMASQAEIKVSCNVPKTGDYAIRVRAWGNQAGPEPARMTIRADGRDLETVDVPATDDEPGVYEIHAKLDAGTHKVAVAFINDYYVTEGPENLRGDRNLAVELIEVQGPIEPDPSPLPESHKRILFTMPKDGDTRAAAREILDRFASLAYRRPLRNDERDRLVELAMRAEQAGEPFERCIQLGVEAALISPHFLFRVEPVHRRGRQKEQEQEQQPPETAEPIGDYELASRLSYFLWSSMPDEELLKLAGEHKLHQPEVLEAQARRMLKDEKAFALVENFAGQWLQLRNLKTVTPAASAFPNFDDSLRDAMRRETELFFESVMRDDQSILTLIDADYTFLNERLARHYGIDGIKGDHFRRVPLSDGRRGGIVSHASVLTVTSNPTRTSPVKRGRWILEQILGTPPPPAPPNIPELMEGEQAALSGSLRERMEQHRADPGCAICHSRMDPLGFGLENYDAVGAWRDLDGKFPIDASGELPGGSKFDGPKELKAILKGKSREFARCMTEKMLTYSLGRGLESTDACAVDAVVESLSSDEMRFSRMVVAIVNSAPFRSRTVEGGR